MVRLVSVPQEGGLELNPLAERPAPVESPGDGEVGTAGDGAGAGGTLVTELLILPNIRPSVPVSLQELRCLDAESGTIE